jgi:hypothetical protein
MTDAQAHNIANAIGNMIVVRNGSDGSRSHALKMLIAALTAAPDIEPEERLTVTHRVDDQQADALLDKIFDKLEKPRGSFRFVVGIRPKRRTTMQELATTNDDQVTIADLTPTSAKGKPAAIDPNVPVTYEADNGAVVTEAPEAGIAAVIDMPDEPFVGDVTITIKGDADVGEGVETITEVIVCHCSHPRATSLGVHAAVRPKP